MVKSAVYWLNFGFNLEIELWWKVFVLLLWLDRRRKFFVVDFCLGLELNYWCSLTIARELGKKLDLTLYLYFMFG